MSLLTLLVPLFAFSAVENPFPIEVELKRGGELVCSKKQKISEGADYFLCETKVQGNRAFARLNVRRFSKNQMMVTGTIEELTPSGRMNISSPAITVVSGMPASVSVDSPESPRDSLSMNVKVIFPDKEFSSSLPDVQRLPLQSK